MNEPIWASGSGKRKKVNAKSRAYEKKLAKDTGGRVSVGSGSSWRAPEDVRSDTHLIQHKFTTKKSFPLKVEELDRIFINANRAGRDGALVIDFERGDGTTLRVSVVEG